MNYQKNIINLTKLKKIFNDINNVGVTDDLKKEINDSFESILQEKTAQQAAQQGGGKKRKSRKRRRKPKRKSRKSRRKPKRKSRKVVAASLNANHARDAAAKKIKYTMYFT